MGLLDGLLTQLGTGDTVKDYKHASKLFVDNNYALSPKMGYLYHVFFDIDPTLYINGVTPDDATEAGMLVKSIDLPKFTIDTKTLNSYGRTAIVQNKVKYDPVNITFHDDSADRIRTIWAKYFTYYYRDMDGGIDKDDSIPAMYMQQDGRYDAKRENFYGFTPLSTEPGHPKNFIKSIRIYSLHQHRFSEYILINPTITAFKHGQHVAGSSDPMQIDMTVGYEFVLYAEGNVSTQTRPGASPTSNIFGFATLHYDHDPSGISPANGTQSILGAGGLFDTTDSVINSLPNDPLGAALKAYRGIQNAGNMNLKQAALGELSQIGMDILRGDNPLNKIAVPGIGDLISKVKSAPTTIDSTSASDLGSSISNGASTAATQLASTAGNALGKMVASLPAGNVITNLVKGGRTLFSAPAKAAASSTPPNPIV